MIGFEKNLVVKVMSWARASLIQRQIQYIYSQSAFQKKIENFHAVYIIEGIIPLILARAMTMKM